MWNLVSSNRFLEMKMRKEAYKRHKDSLRAVKPQIDMQAPQTFAFLLCNPKKNQLARCKGRDTLENMKEIQQENTDLLRRMTFSKERPRSSCRKESDRFSLNETYTKRVTDKVNKENMKMLERLKGASSSISFAKFEKEHQLAERIKSNLSKLKGSTGFDSRLRRPQSAR